LNEIDWLLVDDWAREFVTEVYGNETYRLLEHKSVLVCDPYGNGQDIIDFIEDAAQELVELLSQRLE
jgi:hypothetical protein